MVHKWGSQQLVTDVSPSRDRAPGCQDKMKGVERSCLDICRSLSVPAHMNSILSSVRGWVDFAAGEGFWLCWAGLLNIKMCGEGEAYV